MNWLDSLLLQLGYLRIDTLSPTLTVGEALLAGIADADKVIDGHEWSKRPFVATNNYLDVLPFAGQPTTIFHIQTNSQRYDGWRWLAVYTYKSREWLFVPGEKDKPGVIERLPGGTTAHHGRAWGLLV